MNIEALNEFHKDKLIQFAQRFTDFLIPAYIDRTDFFKMQETLLLKDLKNEDHIFWGAFEDTELLGFIELIEDTHWVTMQEQLYISRLAVSRSAEGKGIASALLLRAEDYAKDQGISQLSLNVFENNQQAIAFYEKRGFKTETRKMIRELY